MEILSRLTPKSHFKIERLDISITDLPFEVLAGSLPKDKLQRLLILAEYADGSITEAARRLHACYIPDLVYKNKWDVPTGINIYKAMSYQAVTEVVTPQVCGQCNGRRGTVKTEEEAVELAGYFDNLGKFHACPACSGSGIRHPNTDTRYKMIMELDVLNYPLDNLNKITYTDWKRKWQGRFDRIYRFVNEVRNAGVRYVRGQLRCDE